MGYKSKYTGQEVENLLDKVNQGGGGSNVISTTYQELKDMRDSGTLQPFQWYRITDFVTTAYSSRYEYGDGFDMIDGLISAGNRYDIIVLAISPREIAADAYASLHEGDDYFGNTDFSKWKIKYSLDKHIYLWVSDVDDSIFKGVIYYMEDEFGNTAYYDFKNILFYQKNDEFGIAGYYYTFNDESLSERIDASLTTYRFNACNVRCAKFDNDGYLEVKTLSIFGIAEPSFSVTYEDSSDIIIHYPLFNCYVRGLRVFAFIQLTEYKYIGLDDDYNIVGYNDIDLFRLLGQS